MRYCNCILLVVLDLREDFFEVGRNGPSSLILITTSETAEGWARVVKGWEESV